MASADPYLNNLLIAVLRRGWLIGYQEVSALSRTRFKRWTGRTPTGVRAQEGLAPS